MLISTVNCIWMESGSCLQSMLHDRHICLFEVNTNDRCDHIVLDEHCCVRGDSISILGMIRITSDHLNFVSLSRERHGRERISSTASPKNLEQSIPYSRNISID